MALNFPNSPSQGSTYAGSNGLSYIFDGVKWNSVPESNVPEAPIDGTQYGREDGAWTAIVGGGSSGVTSLTAGTGISLSGSTGNVTVTNSSPFDNTGDLTVGGNLFIGGNGDYGLTTSSSSIFLKAGSKNCELSSSGTFITPGEFRPSSNNAFNLGAGNFRWSTVYGNDLNASNNISGFSLSLTSKATSASTSSGDGGTTLATKDYVDASSSTPTLQDVTDAGNSTTGDATFGGFVTVNALGLANNKRLYFGSSNQVAQFFSGSHFYTDLNAGNYYIRNGTTTKYTFANNGDFTTGGSISSGSIASTGGQTFNGGMAANGFITCNSRLQAGAHSAANVAFQYVGRTGSGLGFPGNEDVALFAGDNKLFALKSNGTTYWGASVDDNMAPGQNNTKNGVRLASGGQFVHKRNSTNNTGAAFMTGGSNGLFEVRNDGDCVNTNGKYEQTSDGRFKENVVDCKSQWEDIKALRWVNYNFKAETNMPTHTQLGVIAQEAEEVSPGLVSENEVESLEEAWSPAMRSEFDGTYKSVAYSLIAMKSAAALKEALIRVEELERRLDAMDS